MDRLRTLVRFALTVGSEADMRKCWSNLRKSPCAWIVFSTRPFCDAGSVWLAIIPALGLGLLTFLFDARTHYDGKLEQQVEGSGK